jgi:murein DD-endopeptidase MepM/ murein hydrolase activator NlpD
MSLSVPSARALACAAVILLASRDVGAQASLTANPSRPAPGSLVRLTLAGVVSDSIANVSGTMSGEPLHFARSSSGSWRAIGPVSVDATDSVSARVSFTRSNGEADSAVVFVQLPPRPKPTAPARRRQLAVDSRFTRPMDAATQARVERENERAREIGRGAHDTPPMWTESFSNPRPSAITSRFGSGRMFNGTLSSRHLGVDFSGAVGTPVRAANRGVVALVDDFFLAGNVVYIDHGGGVVTGYFHLSKALVAAGDTVEKGQQIGLVGASGRVTGPHLHWSARYGAVTVNPLDLVTLGAP